MTEVHLEIGVVSEGSQGGHMLGLHSGEGRRRFLDVFEMLIYSPKMRLEGETNTLPEVETPICKGPSRWVDRSENVQFVGESAQLTGILNRLHSDDIRLTDVRYVQDMHSTSFVKW
jgi:hypothetical protein